MSVSMLDAAVAHDEEKQSNQTPQVHNASVAEDDFADGMNVEDWLAKYHEDVERLHRQPSLLMDEMITSSEERTNHTSHWRAHIEASDSAGGNGLDSSKVTLNSSVQEAESSLDAIIFTAELAPEAARKEYMVIEGLRTANPKRRKTYMVLACFAVLSFVTLATALILINRNEPLPASPVNQTMIPFVPYNPAPFPPTSAPTGGDINVTIADQSYLDHLENLVSLAALDIGRLFLETVNRTDTNFTFFWASQSASLSAVYLTARIVKFALPIWRGHLVSEPPLKYSYLPCTHVH